MSPLPESNSTAMRSNETSTKTVAPIPQASLPRKLVPNHRVINPTKAFKRRVPNVPNIFLIIYLCNFCLSCCLNPENVNTNLFPSKTTILSSLFIV